MEKEEREEEKMEKEERRYRRDRRGKRGGEVEQRERGAKPVAPLHTPWPKPWAPPVLTWLPGPLWHSTQGSG